MKIRLEEKNLLNIGETIELFDLSKRKFYALLKKGNLGFVIPYFKDRKAIIKEEFEEYLKAHPELKRREKKDDGSKKRRKKQNTKKR